MFAIYSYHHVFLKSVYCILFFWYIPFLFVCLFISVSVAFSSESLDHEFGGSVSSLRRASHSKARAKHRLTESPSHNN